VGRTVKGIGGKKPSQPDSPLAEAATILPDAAIAEAATMASDVAIAEAATMASDVATDDIATVASTPRAKGIDFGPSSLVPVLRSYYEFISEYGRGGLGKISEARDRRTGRIVAIKEMLPSASNAGARFAREAVVTANLQHPSIVPVYEVGMWEEDGGPFYAMKLVAGQPLEEVMRAATSPNERLVLLPEIHAVAEAIAYAHAQGVIHRDLKPANVLVGDFGETVVIDWGLAKRRGDTDDTLPGATASPTSMSLTLDGDVMGTPAYMSPEQAAGKPVDETTDVYAVGVILYELFAGKVPFANAKTVAELLHAVKEETPPKLASVAPGTPPDLIAIVEKAMARAPGDRYASGRGLAEDLRNFQTGKLVGARAYSSRSLLARWIKRHRLPVTMAAVMLVTLVVGAAVSVKRIVQEKRVAVRATVASNHSLASAYNQMAIRQLERGRSLRALTYVSEAAELSKTLNPTDRLVAGMATLPLQPLVDTVIGDGRPLISLVESFDSTRVVASTKQEIRWFDTSTWQQVARSTTKKEIRGALFLPDGRLLRITDDAKVENEEGESVTLQEGALTAILSPDQRQILIGTRTGEVHIRSTADALEAVRSWKASESPVWRIAADPTGRVVATDSDDVVLWDAQTATEIGRLLASAYPVFSPDGSRVAVISEFGYGFVLHIAQANSASIERNLDHGTDAVTSALFSSDGSAIMTTAGSLLRWWDVETGTLLYRRDVGEEAWLVAATRDLNCITANRLGRIESHTPTSSVSLHATGAAPSAVVYNLNNGTLMSSAYDGNIYRWKLNDQAQVVPPPKASDEVRDVIYAPSNDAMLVIGNDGTAEVRNLATNVTSAIESTVALAAFSPEGKTLALAHNDGTITVRALTAVSSPTTHTRASDASRIVALSTSTNGHFLAALGSNNSIEIWNLKTGTKPFEVESSVLIKCLEFSPDNRWALACAADGQNLLFDLKTDKQTTIATSHLWTNAATFAPAGDAFILGGNVKAGDSGAVVVVTPDATGHRVQELSVVGMSASIATFSPKGTRLVLGLSDRIEVWDSSATTLVATLPTGGETLSHVVFDAEENILMAAFDSGDIVLWDIDSGMEVMRKSWSEEASVTLRADAGQAIIRTEGEAVIWSPPYFSGDMNDLKRMAECYSAWRIRDGAQILSKASPALCRKQP